MQRWIRATALLSVLLPLLLACGVPPGDGIGHAGETRLSTLASDSTFGALVARLSGPGAYFDTDNLISNERSYLHVSDALRGLEAGGAYVGVGPDQNFSYIAASRPSVAVIVDIRRDNLLLHLLFKALLERSPTRIEFLARLTGRPPPENPAAWRDRDVEDLVEWVDRFPVAPDPFRATARDEVARRVTEFGIPLSPEDLRTVRRFHETFIREGLDLRFRSHGRRPRFYYPTLRQLLLETDRRGRPASYLARPEDYATVRTLSLENRIVPVVGDLAGGHALPELARWLEENGLALSSFYASNVEFYLDRAGTLDRFVENLRRLPRRDGAVLVRSYFGGVYGRPHPRRVPGYASVQLTQRIAELLRSWDDGAIRSYRDLLRSATAEGAGARESDRPRPPSRATPASPRLLSQEEASGTGR